mmetsp:Transcript_41370/g.93197  ORF Transcript_41370/g.93197 Transcript_41370/m.93197 type:complete len:379 (-) Transcript_41370:141-1277(-)
MSSCVASSSPPAPPQPTSCAPPPFRQPEAPLPPQRRRKRRSKAMGGRRRPFSGQRRDRRRGGGLTRPRCFFWTTPASETPTGDSSFPTRFWPRCGEGTRRLGAPPRIGVACSKNTNAGGCSWARCRRSRISGPRSPSPRPGSRPSKRKAPRAQTRPLFWSNKDPARTRRSCTGAGWLRCGRCRRWSSGLRSRVRRCSLSSASAQTGSGRCSTLGPPPPPARLVACRTNRAFVHHPSRRRAALGPSETGRRTTARRRGTWWRSSRGWASTPLAGCSSNKTISRGWTQAVAAPRKRNFRRTPRKGWKKGPPRKNSQFPRRRGARRRGRCGGQCSRRPSACSGTRTTALGCGLPRGRGVWSSFLPGPPPGREPTWRRGRKS